MAMSGEAPQGAVPQSIAEQSLRRQARQYTGEWVGAACFGMAIGGVFGGFAYAANVTLPAGMFRMEPNFYPAGSVSDNEPQSTLALAGTQYGSEFPRDKHFGFVIGVADDEVAKWVADGCDHPVIGFETSGGVVDAYSLQGMDELGTVEFDGERYRALVKMAESSTNQVALGCARQVGGEVTWAATTYDLSGGPLPFVDAEKMGVPGVV